jgi:hypothetical protein
MRVILEKLYGEASVDDLVEITAACAFANTLYIVRTLHAAQLEGCLITVDRR